MYEAAMFINWPQVYELGAPKPRKLTAASVRTDAAIWRVASTIMMWSTLGNRWRKSILFAEAPIWREAAMYSNSLTLRTSPRIILAAPGQEKAPIMNTTSHNPPVALGLNLIMIWRKTKSRRKNGMTRKTSVSLISRLSSQLPKYPAASTLETAIASPQPGAPLQ